MYDSTINLDDFAPSEDFSDAAFDELLIEFAGSTDIEFLTCCIDGLDFKLPAFYTIAQSKDGAWFWKRNGCSEDQFETREAAFLAADTDFNCLLSQREHDISQAFLNGDIVAIAA